MRNDTVNNLNESFSIISWADSKGIFIQDSMMWLSYAKIRDTEEIGQ